MSSVAHVAYFYTVKASEWIVNYYHKHCTVLKKSNWDLHFFVSTHSIGNQLTENHEVAIYKIRAMFRSSRWHFCHLLPEKKRQSHWSDKAVVAISEKKKVMCFVSPKQTLSPYRIVTMNTYSEARFTESKSHGNPPLILDSCYLLLLLAITEWRHLQIKFDSP